jgi:ribosomal protein L18
VNLLAAKLYDPAVAVNKVTTAALAMTAIDTTNLRLAVTVPAHGMVRFRLMACLHGATTYPSILLGVMVGAAVKGRVAPVQALGNTAVATALVNVEADFIVTGLAPGATNFDAAYAVETLVAATGLKFGGPDNTTANDAFGGFVFEAWDPQPMTANNTLAVDANGRVDVSKVAGTAQTARDLGAQLDAAVTSRLAAASYTAPDNTRPPNFTAMSITAGGLVDVTQAAADKVWSTTARTLTSLGTLVADVWGALVATFTVPGTVGKLVKDDLDATVSSRLASASYAAPDNAGVAAIKTKTDSLTFSVAGKVDSNVKNVKDSPLLGSGTALDPWHP